MRGGHGGCTFHGHTPPATLDWKPGQRYRHICLKCGFEVVMRAPVRDYSLNAPTLVGKILDGLEAAVRTAEDRPQQIALCRLSELTRQLQRELSEVIESNREESAADAGDDDRDE